MCEMGVASARIHAPSCSQNSCSDCSRDGILGDFGRTNEGLPSEGGCGWRMTREARVLVVSFAQFHSPEGVQAEASMAEAESSDEEWDTVERPAFYSGSPHEKETRREPTPEPYGELTVASVFDYTIERQGLRLCVTFAIQVVTAEGDAPEAASPDDFDAGGAAVVRLVRARGLF